MSQNTLDDRFLMREGSARLRDWHRYIILSPQITILVVVAGLLIVVLTVLVAIVFNEAQAANTVLGYTAADQNRVFVQGQREALKLLRLVDQPIERFDAAEATLQTQILESRLNLIQRERVLENLPDEIASNTFQLMDMWPALQQSHK